MTIKIHTNKIFAEPNQLLKESDTLVRLSRIDQILPQRSVQRKTTRDVLTALFKEVLSQNLDQVPDAVPDAVKEGLKKQKMALAFPRGSLSVQKWAQRALKDLHSLSISPIKKSQRGDF